MASPNIPKHIKADVQKLAYDRTIESIQRITDTFDNTSDFLALAASASMNASFLMLYCAARIKHGTNITPERLYAIWGETMQEEFDHMTKGFDAAKQYTKEYLDD